MLQSQIKSNKRFTALRPENARAAMQEVDKEKSG